jgi:hypothetical protein
MSVDQQFNSVLQKIKEIYQFLTEGDPSPDDEIEAREKLLTSFNSLKTINPSSNLIGKIDEILEDLRNWDSLELWFSETSLPMAISNILGLPEKQSIEDSKLSDEKTIASKEEKVSEPEIDLTDIFNKVSDQFKGEIDNLKGKIEELKIELEKKDASLKSIRETKKVKKITPKREVKLPPPKIRIPVIKKSISPPSTTKSIKTETISESELQKPKETEIKVEDAKVNIQNQKLIPIPTESISNDTKEKVPELIPIPIDHVKSKTVKIPLPEDKPDKTEKRRLVPIVTEEDSTISEPSKLPEELEKPAEIDTHIISSVEVEEVESEEIKSTGMDLFNVFSSVGKEESKHAEPMKKPETFLNNPPPKMAETEKVDSTPKAATFVNFGSTPQTESTSKSTHQYTSGEELSSDKDTLYQELIALEGRRYSLEKSYQELDTLYNKGSIANSKYKDESDNLKSKLGEITSRIYKIRRIISSL